MQAVKGHVSVTKVVIVKVSLQRFHWRKYILELLDTVIVTYQESGQVFRSMTTPPETEMPSVTNKAIYVTVTDIRSQRHASFNLLLMFTLLSLAMQTFNSRNHPKTAYFNYSDKVVNHYNKVVSETTIADKTT